MGEAASHPGTGLPNRLANEHRSTRTLATHTALRAPSTCCA